MKKLFSLMILSLLVLSIGAVSAKTLIAGKIYNADFSETISGADVTVTCNGHIQTTTSLSDGSYSVTYKETGSGSCDSGDTLSVYASHPDYGANSKTGVINDDVFGNNWDLAIVNVPLVPEFGLIVGALTLLSALGVFFLIRRE